MADLSKRKRKIACDFIFEVGENEISPVNSPNSTADRNTEYCVKSPKTLKLEEANSNSEANLNISKENIEETNLKSTEMLKQEETNSNSEANLNTSEENVEETNLNDLKTENDSGVVNIGEVDGSEYNTCTLQDSIIKQWQEENEASSVKDSVTDKTIEIVEQHITEVVVSNAQSDQLDQKDSKREEHREETKVIQAIEDMTEMDIDNGICDLIIIDETKDENKESIDSTNTSTESLTKEHIEDIENIAKDKHLSDNLISNLCTNSENMNSDILITVNFKSKIVGELFKGKILDALTKLQEFNVVDKVDTDNEIVLSPKFDTDLNALKEFELAKYKKRKKRHAKKTKDDMFVLDTKPSYNKHENIHPQYSSKFSIDKTGDDIEQVKTGPLCFNCSEKHSLRDCPLPKNFVRINKMKSKFKKVARYHVDEDQKYADFKPGKISINLKEALGLRNNELPPYIYRMRVLGYPPGWVEEAFESQSELSLFDSNGKMVGTSKKNECKVDPDKIIEYVGFNAPMDKYMKDEYDYYKCQRYSKHINKDTIIEAIKKLKDNFETCDMEIDNEPEDELPPPGCENEIKKLQSQRDSPSLTELEKQKLELLAELDKSELKIMDNINKKKDENEVTTECNSNQDLNLDSDDSNSLNKSNIVKESSFGTPIFKRESSFCKLPHIDNFSINMTPIINFENLPNTTGTYEKMAGILEKVRKKLKDPTESNL